MRSASLLAIILAAAGGLLLSCADDPPIEERPADGTAQAWESCVWEGSVDYDLCAPDLACTDYGFCLPTCERDEDCNKFEFGDVCKTQSTQGQDVCVITCDATKPCPDTGGVVLQCSVFGECK